MPCSYTPRGITQPMFCGQGDRVNPSRHLSYEGTKTVGICDLTLVICKLKPEEDISAYNLQRVVRQLGYDQGAVKEHW